MIIQAYKNNNKEAVLANNNHNHHNRPTIGRSISFDPYASISSTSLYLSDIPIVASQENLDLPSNDDHMLSPQVDERSIDINYIVNTSIIAIALIFILVKLMTVDVGMMRGWTIHETSLRIAVDNWAGYNSVLESNPVFTKAMTSATVYTIGDYIAQRTEGISMSDLDWPRIIRSMLAGLIAHGPMSHVWYNFSEWFFDDIVHCTAWWSFIPKVILDQTTWGPFWNNTYILLLGIMKMESLETIWDDMKRTTIPLIVSGLKLWPLAHSITYGVIPVPNRLLWVDIVEIVWVMILATHAAGAVGDEHNHHHGAITTPQEEEEEEMQYSEQKLL